MSHPCGCPHEICACRLTLARANDLPQTLCDVRAMTDVVPLGHNLEGLALLGTQFEDAFITTQNESAVMTGRGGYGRFMNRGEVWRPLMNRVNLRVSEHSNLALSRCSSVPAQGLPTALIASDRNGNIVHRIHAVSSYDQNIAQALDEDLSEPWPTPRTVVQAHNVIQFPAIRQARMNWNEAGVGGHLNDLLSDRGRLRLHTLRHLSADAAWRISPTILPSFLMFLNDRNTPFVRGIVTDGMLQATCGPTTSVTEVDGIQRVSSAKSYFALNCAKLDEVWVIVVGKDYWIECYSHQNGIQSVIMCDPMFPEQDWRGFLSALPLA